MTTAPPSHNLHDNPSLNSDVILNNTHQVLDLINDLLPFSIEITEKIIAYAYYLDAPNVLHDDETTQSTISIPSSATNLTKNGGRFNNLKNLILVNSGFHFICLQFQYKYCNFVRSFNFSKFLFNLINLNQLGDYIRVLDFQEFTAVGLGKSIESIYKIPNLTSKTLLKCLQLSAKNLNTLLLNESIDNDINLDILSFIFNDLKNLKSLDFCGSSNLKFIDYFNELEIKNEKLNLVNLSFHECLNLPLIAFEKLLSITPALKKLDLSHTQITLKSLNQFLNRQIRLSHLSLRKCTQLGTINEFINFLKHPSICNIKERKEQDEGQGETELEEDDEEERQSNLIWLNIQNCFSSDTLTSEKLDEILDILTVGAFNLEYLNLNGYANVNGNHIKKISENFLNLKSLSISDLNLDYNDVNDLNIVKELNSLANLRYLDFSSNIFNFTTLKNLINSLNYIEVFEIKQYLSTNLSHCFKISKINDQLNYFLIEDYSNIEYWRVFNNKGISRRCWVHKLINFDDCKYYDNYENETTGGKLIEWDIANGNLILKLIKRVNWLGLACVKINCFEDEEFSEFDNKFCNDSTVRGIYKYYSLNV